MKKLQFVLLTTAMFVVACGKRQATSHDSTAIQASAAAVRKGANAVKLPLGFSEFSVRANGKIVISDLSGHVVAYVSTTEADTSHAFSLLPGEYEAQIVGEDCAPRAGTASCSAVSDPVRFTVEAGKTVKPLILVKHVYTGVDLTRAQVDELKLRTPEVCGIGPRARACAANEICAATGRDNTVGCWKDCSKNPSVCSPQEACTWAGTARESPLVQIEGNPMKLCVPRKML